MENKFISAREVGSMIIKALNDAKINIGEYEEIFRKIRILAKAKNNNMRGRQKRSTYLKPDVTKIIQAYIQGVELSLFLVFINSLYIRDTQIFNLDAKITNEEFEKIDIMDLKYEDMWEDFNPNIYVGTYLASSEQDACEVASNETNYDKRILIAEER